MHERLSYANHTAGGTSAVSVQFVGGILRHCIQYGHTECHKQVSRRDTTLAKPDSTRRKPRLG